MQLKRIAKWITNAAFIVLLMILVEEQGALGVLWGSLLLLVFYAIYFFNNWDMIKALFKHNKKIAEKMLTGEPSDKK